MVIGCLCAVLNIQAQDILTDEIQWNASGFTDVLSGAVVEDAPCIFRTHGDQGIDWVQGDGTFVSTFSVTATSGSWPDLTEFGSIEFQGTLDGLSGTITISRSSLGMKIDLVLIGGSADVNNSYVISSFALL